MATDAQLIEAAKHGDGAFLAANLEDYKPGTGPDPRLETIKDADGKTLLEIAAAVTSEPLPTPSNIAHADAVLELIINKGAWLPEKPVLPQWKKRMIELVERLTLWGEPPPSLETLQYAATVDLLTLAATDFRYSIRAGISAPIAVFGPTISEIQRGDDYLAPYVEGVPSIGRSFLRRAGHGDLKMFADRMMADNTLGQRESVSNWKNSIKRSAFYEILESGRHFEWFIPMFGAIDNLGERLATAALKRQQQDNAGRVATNER